MKRKLKGVLGIGLTLVLLASLTIGLAVPAAADPGKLKFTTLTLPKVEDWTTHTTFVDAEGDYWAAPGTDVGPIATSPDGDILFAAVGADSYLSSSWYDVLKSTDGGYSWAATGFYDEWTDVTDTTPIVDIVVSPDYEDDITVFVATEDLLYQSVDGGKHFVAMTTGWDADEAITDLDVALDDRGRLAYMVGTWGGVSAVDLETAGTGTAEWSTTPTPPYGDYCVKLTCTGSGLDQWAAAKVAYGKTLATLVGLGVDYVDPFNVFKVEWPIWYDTASGTRPYAMLWIDEDADGTIDTRLTGGFGVAEPALGTDETWQEARMRVDAGWQLRDYDEGVISTYTGGYTGDAYPVLMANYLADEDCEDAIVEYVGVAYTASAIAAYVDDITIGDVVYPLDQEGGDVYVLATATGMSWQAQGIGDYDVLAVAFSPLFADDEGIGAVVTSASKTRVRWSFAYIGAPDPGIGWGADIGDGKIKTALMTEFASAHARMAFPDDFDAWGIGNNICFVGVYSAAGYAAHANALGDVYKVVLKSGSTTATDLDIRGVLTTLLPTATDIVSIDVCGNAEDASILVGTDYSDLTITPEQFLTYYSDDGGETWRPSATKSPTGGDVVFRDSDTVLLITDDAMTYVLMTPDYCDSGIGYAATRGVYTSAFSRTKDSAATWSQISIIDYGDGTDGYTIVDLDAAGYNADDMLHMTTSAVGNDGAVWKRTGGKNWERIWSYAHMGVTDDIIELIIKGDDTMFAIDYTTKDIGGSKYIGYIWRSSDMGATWPKKITTKPDLTEVCIVSPTTLYTGHTDGGLWWSTKSGTGWTKPEDNPMTSAIVMMSITGDNVLIGNVGAVHFSSDGGETVERVGGAGDAGTAACLPGFDLGFADNNIIYSSDAGGTGRVYRTELDFADPGDSEWESIDDIQDLGAPYYQEDVIGAGPPGTAPPSGIMYIVDTAPVVKGDKAGGLWRCTNPLADVDSPVPPYFEKENKGLDTDDELGGKDADVFPFTLFCAVSNATTSVPYYEQIVVFTDTLDSGVTLADPGDGAAGVGLIAAGEVYPAVKVVWKEMAGATRYEVQLAIDPDFTSVVEDWFTESLISPGLTLSPNKTYYWRVRVAAQDEYPVGNLLGAPLISPWSETWKFKTAIGATMARPELEAPDAGEVDVLLSPTFEWSGIAWAERYEFELSTGSSTTAGGYFTDVLVGLTGTNALVSTAWKCDIALDYEARYYWHVKAFGVDTETPWSDVGTFTTMSKPVLPPEPTAPVVIPPMEEITPMWIWVIIGIGAALMIAVVILIVTTRRVP